MKTKVQTVSTHCQNPHTGEKNLRIVIRTDGGQLMTSRLTDLLKCGSVAYIPDQLLDDLKDGYNDVVAKAGFSELFSLEEAEWPENGAEREHLALDLLKKRHELISIRRQKEATEQEILKIRENKNDVRGKNTKLKATIEDLEAQITSLKENIESLEIDAEELRKENTELKNNVIVCNDAMNKMGEKYGEALKAQAAGEVSAEIERARALGQAVGSPNQD